MKASSISPRASRASIVELLMMGDTLRTDLESVDLAAALEAGNAVAETEAKFAVPVETARNIIAVGLNYREHTKETNLEAPTTPLLFAKWASSLAGPHTPIALDSSISKQVDYEVELAVVIGKRTLDVTAAEALDHVAGYTVSNDISARDVQFAEAQWTRAKSFDGFCPIGPWLTSADAVPNPQLLQLSCSINGERKQNGNTSQMVFGVADIIAFASRSLTLLPGDIILTGTPSGVAMGAEVPRWLRPGDILRSEIEGLGVLENAMVARA
ncbi:MAG TPA: fumarylacetoacetate hydrolase family protein [Terrimesophilobacter sp.]|nr:fumarylacetoacetate hydrolase family protein [Terrimesophilobacter sp.]